MTERKMVLDGIYQRYHAKANPPPVWIVPVRPKLDLEFFTSSTDGPTFPPPITDKEYRLVEITETAAFYRSVHKP